MIDFSGEFLSFKDTLTCGQVFRFYPCDGGFTVVSRDRAAFVQNLGNRAIIDSSWDDYFKAYFDLDRDYKAILKAVLSCKNPKVTLAANAYHGIRILNQDKEEAFFSFMISQNNNIPRIKSTVEKLSARLGKEFTFRGQTLYAFPTTRNIADASLSDLFDCGLGYRAQYLKEAAQGICLGQIDLEALSLLPTEDLKRELMKIKGVGDKVANCVTLFGFKRGDSFPVDTWIEKIYSEDFGGKLKDRRKISLYFLDLFKENSGYVQQYLFHAKRQGLLD